MENNIIRSILEIQHDNPDIYVGGSISLILQGVIPYREINDIDLIYNKKIHINDLFNIDEGKNFKNKIYHNGVKHELFINKDAEYVNFNYNGVTIKLSPIDETINWKRIFYNRYKTEKHFMDLSNMCY